MNHINPKQVEPMSLTPTFQVTDLAIAKIHALTKHQAVTSHPSMPPKQFRIAIQSGGCSGFQYQFSLDDNITENDLIFTFEQKTDVGILATCVVDQGVLPFIQGATLNYKHSIQESRFTMENPNADATCGCGVSFCLKE